MSSEAMYEEIAYMAGKKVTVSLADGQTLNGIVRACDGVVWLDGLRINAHYIVTVKEA